MEVSLLEQLGTAKFTKGKSGKKAGFWARKKFTSILSASQLKAAKTAGPGVLGKTLPNGNVAKTSLNPQTMLKGALSVTADPENPGLKHSVKSRAGKAFPTAKQHLTDLVIAKSESPDNLEAQVQDYLNRLDASKKKSTKKGSNKKGSDVALQLLSIPVDRKAEIKSFKANLEKMIKGDKVELKPGTFTGRIDPEAVKLSGSDLEKLKNLIEELGQIQTGKKKLSFKKDGNIPAGGHHRFSRLTTAQADQSPMIPKTQVRGKKPSLKERIMAANTLKAPEGEKAPEVTVGSVGKKKIAVPGKNVVTQVVPDQKKDAFKELWGSIMNPAKENTPAVGRFMGRQDELPAMEMPVVKPTKGKAQRIKRGTSQQDPGMNKPTAQEKAQHLGSNVMKKAVTTETTFQETLKDVADPLSSPTEATPRKAEQSTKQTDMAEPRKTARVSDVNATAKAETAKAPPQMFKQVQEGIRTAYIVRPKAVTVRLSPEELGEVQVQVTQENDQVKAKIQTETQKVAAVLKDHQAELEHRLREQGVDLDHIDIRDDMDTDTKKDREDGAAAGQTGQQQDEGHAQRGRGQGTNGEAGVAGATGEREAEVETRESNGALTVEAAANRIQEGKRFSMRV